MVFEPNWIRHNPAKVRKPAAVPATAKPTAAPPAGMKGTETVRELRDRGLTVQQIVNSLNARSTPRPDGKPWTSNMVETLLARAGGARRK